MEYKDFKKFINDRTKALIDGTPLPEKPDNYEELMDTLTFERNLEIMTQQALEDKAGIYTTTNTAGVTFVERK